MWLRIRFKASSEDYRPVKFPPHQARTGAQGAEMTTGFSSATSESILK